MLGLSLGLTSRRGAAGPPPLNRVTPPGLPTLPILPTAVIGPGNVTVSRSVIDAVLADEAAKYSPGTLYVRPSTGNDANAGTQAQPLRTLTQAVRTSLPSLIIIDEPCTLEPFDFRNTDASQTAQSATFPNGVLKHIRTTHPVTIAVAAPTNLATATWTAHPTIADVWQTTVATSSSGTVHRLMRTDQADAEGEPKELFRAAAEADLGALASGWFITTASGAKTLTVKLGTGISVQANRAVLKANWLGSAGVSRIQNLGTDLVLEGPIITDGCYITGIAGGGRPPRLWCMGTRILRSPATGVEMQAGSAYLQNCFVHSSVNDCFNSFTGPTAPTHGMMLAINSTFTLAGATDHQGTAVSGNRNATSAHGGLHHVAYGSTYRRSHGPDLADSSSNGHASVSWLVGCKSEGPSQAGNPNFAFGSPSTGSRAVFMDTCTSTGGTTIGLQNANPANTTVKTHACTFSGGTSGTIGTYDPAAPA